jgi:hypothetical protein
MSTTAFFKAPLCSFGTPLNILATPSTTQLNTFAVLGKNPFSS